MLSLKLHVENSTTSGAPPESVYPMLQIPVLKYPRWAWVIRTNPSIRPIDKKFDLKPRPRSEVLVLNLENRHLSYQRYRWGSDRRVAWLDLLQSLRQIKNDKKAGCLVINLSGFSARPSLAWEMRQMLQDIRDVGIRVVIQIDRAGMLQYYLASVADDVCIDPQGSITLPGMAVKRTYVKGALDKLGLGFQEFRYMSHKTAVESMSRSTMSEADRQQYGRMIDVIYETIREGVAVDRELSEADFDAVVDNDVRLSAKNCMERKLVNRIGRWDDLLRPFRNVRSVEAPRGWSPPLDQVWGQPKRIAVVYLVGLCAMDSGIKGRASSAFMRALSYDSSIAAVVIRADSPGGDPLPSDLIAEATRMLRKAGKPVIISQGDVAGSGGYWISMDGTHILTTPLTITGSIGVISGWLYDQGLGQKLGLTADGLSRGAHADLFTSLRLPLLGMGIPTRPQNEDELKKTETYILDMYTDFLAAVARGRNLEEDRVRELAEGRIWMGEDAVKNELVDSIGTLSDALDLAAAEAGLSSLDNVEIFEYPPRKLFKMPSLMPSLPGILGRLLTGNAEQEVLVSQDSDIDENYVLKYLKTLARSPGQPSMMMTPDLLPDVWVEDR